jgi:agmatine deiminase
MGAMQQTPFQLGFSMPPEWHYHEATYLSWPKNPETFPKKIIGKVEETYCKMIEALSQHEQVKLLVDNEQEELRVSKLLSSTGSKDSNLLFLRIPSVDVWIRDYGPTFLLNKKSGKKAAVDWIFNAWGAKYDDLMQDEDTGKHILDSLPNGTHEFSPPIVMEGGSFDTNGDGLLLTTEQCLLNKNRNPSMGRQQIEQYLKDYLGVSRVIWLKEGIEGDDTDGHVDDFARFVGKKTVICAQEENKNDPNHATLEKNASLLRESGLEVAGLPMPSPLIDKEEGIRLPASYANFYIANKCVLLPTFGEKKDNEAADILSSFFSGREIISIPARELVFGFGGIHCVTQQEPKQE